MILRPNSTLQLVDFKECGEPGRNRTFNQQIKSPSLTCPRSAAACFSLGNCFSQRPCALMFSVPCHSGGRQGGRQISGRLSARRSDEGPMRSWHCNHSHGVLSSRKWAVGRDIWFDERTSVTE